MNKNNDKTNRNSYKPKYLNKWEKLLITLLIGGLLIGLLVDYDRTPPEQNKKDSIQTLQGTAAQ